MTPLGLLLLASTVAARDWILPPDYDRYAPRAPGFKWEPCETGSHIDCSWFEVPLDWSNEAAGKATLAVARYNAPIPPKLGTMFVNPGGPGVSGVEMVMGLGEKLTLMSGGRYDIVGWDPRGVGRSTPRTECFKTATEQQLFWEGTVPQAGLEARGNFTDKQDIDAFYGQLDKVDGLLKKLGQKCLESSPDIWQYIGSVAAVRDMIAMHDILEDPKKPIDFWGMSYGTIIGIYFVNMFPDRVGRVVLDGVVDPVYWANRPPHEIWSVGVESTDEAFTGFVTACAAAGPTGCALATKDSTPETIRDSVINLIDIAYDYVRQGGDFGSSYVRDRIFKGMYEPSNWPQLADDLLSLYVQMAGSTIQSSAQTTKRSFARSIHDITRRGPGSFISGEDTAVGYAIHGVTCADAIDAGTTTTKDVFDFVVNVTRTVSPMFGPSWAIAGFYCHHWPVRAVERYTGPWNKTLSNPILVIGNKADPITPYISAKRVADALGDSAILIEQDDYGHVSVAMMSDCTTLALEDYFVNNKLPAQDKTCETNQQLFPGPGITKSRLDALAASANSTSTTNLDSLHDALSKAVQRGDSLFIAVIALAVATGLLLLGLVFSFVYIRRRSKSQPMHPVFIPRGSDEKAAKSGEYSRIES